MIYIYFIDFFNRILVYTAFLCVKIHVHHISSYFKCLLHI